VCARSTIAFGSSIEVFAALARRSRTVHAPVLKRTPAREASASNDAREERVKRRQGSLAIALAVTLFAAPSAVRAGGPEEATRARGKEIYRVYCQNCHGESGAGDGPMAQLLTVRPSDLTRLAAADGTFPFERVYRAIDGRLEVKGHGASDMPVWGLTFRDRGSDVDQEDEVRGKILALIEHLRSIQRVRPWARPPEPTPTPVPTPVPAPVGGGGRR
jgi:mono/diheme cytochrome c family protein